MTLAAQKGIIHAYLGGLKMSVNTKELLTVQEICDLLKVGKPYIYWLTHQRAIPFIKMHGHLRFRRSDIDDWLGSMEVRNVDLPSER